MRLATSCLLAFLAYTSLPSAATYDGTLDLERSEALSPVRRSRDDWRKWATRGEGARDQILEAARHKLTTAWTHYRDAALESRPGDQIPTAEEMVQAFLTQHGQSSLIQQPDGSDLVSAACKAWTDYVTRLHQLEAPAHDIPTTPTRRKGRTSSGSSTSSLPELQHNPNHAAGNGIGSAHFGSSPRGSKPGSVARSSK